MSRLLYISNLGGKKFKGSFGGSSISAAHLLGIDYFAVANRSNTTLDQIKIDENNLGIRILHADIARSPFSLCNLRAYKQVVSIIKENQIDYIHCNTPVGGVIGRLAGKKCKVKRVVYQAHGFHFYKGAPLINWLLYYPIERILAHYTNALIVINHEDYEIAQKFRLKNKGHVYYVPGVGINTNNIRKDETIRLKVRSDLQIPEDAFLVISAGEINKNKNIEVVLKAIKNLNLDKLYYIICGEGPLKDSLKSEFGSDRIRFLGYRNDVINLLSASDIFVLSSFREGLSRSIMEAMCVGLPCVVSKIRGNVDLIRNKEMLCDPKKEKDFENAFRMLIDNSDFYKKVSETNRRVIDEFSLESVTQELLNIYSCELNN